jgi:hypothetical protein
LATASSVEVIELPMLVSPALTSCVLPVVVALFAPVMTVVPALVVVNRSPSIPPTTPPTMLPSGPAKLPRLDPKPLEIASSPAGRNFLPIS